MLLVRSLAAFSRALTVLAALSICLMMLHVVVDVFCNYAFSAPLIGTLEIVSYYYMVSAVFLPLALVEWRNQHIYVDLFYQRFSPTFRRAADILALLLSAGFFAMLAYQSGIDALRAISINEMALGSAYMPIWPSRILLPVGFGATALVCLLRLAQRALPGSLPPIASAPTTGDGT